MLTLLTGVRRRGAAAAATALLAVAFAAMGAPVVDAAPIAVHCPADDLQAAIAAAPSGAKLRVSGTCTGTFTITRSITLKGEQNATLQDKATPSLRSPGAPAGR